MAPRPRGDGRRRHRAGRARAPDSRIRWPLHVRVGRFIRARRLVAGRPPLRGVELPPPIDRRDGTLDRLAEHVRRPGVDPRPGHGNSPCHRRATGRDRWCRAGDSARSDGDADHVPHPRLDA